MTATILPLYASNAAAGEALMRNLSAQIKTMKNDRETTSKKYSTWRSLNEAPASAGPDIIGEDMMTNALVGVLLDSVLGMGLFSGMGEGMKEVLHNLADYMISEHDEEGKEKQSHTLDRFQNTNDHLQDQYNRHAKLLEEREYQHTIALQAQQIEQMKKLQQMMAMLMSNMLAHKTEEKGKSSGETDDNAMRTMLKKKHDDSNEFTEDVLGRNPRSVQFKQNKDNVACIRKLFIRGTQEAVKPKFTPAMRLAM